MFIAFSRFYSSLNCRAKEIEVCTIIVKEWEYNIFIMNYSDFNKEKRMNGYDLFRSSRVYWLDELNESTNCLRQRFGREAVFRITKCTCQVTYNNDLWPTLTYVPGKKRNHKEAGYFLSQEKALKLTGKNHKTTLHQTR